MATYQITKIKAGRWAGHYVPVSYRVDELNDLGHHTRRIGVYSTIQEAQAAITEITESENQ